ncbi:MAG: antibiotic biosynthesis monooxygenase [Planctomycetota bacterium]
MIARVWTGWTTPEGADAYEHTLRSVILPRFESHFDADGYLGTDTYRREDTEGPDGSNETEFMTVLFFDSEQALRAGVGAAVGEDPTVAHLPPESKQHLKRWEERARHFGVRQQRDDSMSAGAQG